MSTYERRAVPSVAHQAEIRATLPSREVRFGQRPILLIQLLGQGLTRNQIAQEMKISPKTVDNHLILIMKKTEIHTASGIVAYGFEHDIIPGRNSEEYTGETLSLRQKDILALLAQGLQDAGISKELGISRKTITNHLDEIFKKMGVHNRHHAVAVSYRSGLLGSKQVNETTTPKATKPIVVFDAESHQAQTIQLSNRQREILRLLQGGNSAKVIGAELTISARTVDNHLYALYRKLGVNSWHEAVDKAELLGLLVKE